MDAPIQAAYVWGWGTIDRVPIRTRPARREASTLENLQLALPRVEPVDPPLSAYLLTKHSMQPLPLTWLQPHRRGSSIRV
jgi:hypothetical protein